MEAREFYDGFGADYDLMVPWEKRLPREEAFFRRVFEAYGARSVLDAACGTGRHAAAFARLGYEASGADVSPVMVERARAHAAERGVRAEFRAAGFGELSRAFPGPFGAVTCVGNSLPHLLDDGLLRAALADMRAVLRPGGVLVIQNRNYDRVLRERSRFMPPNSRVTETGEVVFVRITDIVSEDRIDFTVLTLSKAGGKWDLAARTTPLRPLRRHAVESALSVEGFRDLEVLGGYGGEAFDASASQDLVVIARA
jgi:glycine/sarcosine N-methyltransferase